MIAAVTPSAQGAPAGFASLGSFTPGDEAPAFTADAILDRAGRFREPCFVVREARQGHIGVAFGGRVEREKCGGRYHVLACLPPFYPEWLGDRSFNETHGVRFPYVAGEMAQGIAAPRMVVEMCRSGMLGFFGAAGLPLDRIEAGLNEISAGTSSTAWGANLIHSPQTPEDEARTAELYIRRKVRNVSASAYMKLNANVVHYATAGLRMSAAGEVVREHHVFAKVSRPETAEQFLSPPPPALLTTLLRQGAITATQARLAAELPVADGGGPRCRQATSLAAALGSASADRGQLRAVGRPPACRGDHRKPVVPDGRTLGLCPGGVDEQARRFGRYLVPEFARALFVRASRDAGGSCLGLL